MKTYEEQPDDYGSDPEVERRLLLADMRDRFRAPETRTILHQSLGLIAVTAGNVNLNAFEPELPRQDFPVALINRMDEERVRADLLLVDNRSLFTRHLQPTEEELAALSDDVAAIDEYQRHMLETFEPDAAVQAHVEAQLNFPPLLGYSHGQNAEQN